MSYVVMYCRKCGLEVPSFNRESDERFQRAMNRLKVHMKQEHPRVRKFHRNIDWFDRDKPHEKKKSQFKENGARAHRGVEETTNGKK